MDKQEAMKLIKEISNDFYKVVRGWVKENWRQPIPEPVDTYIHYDNKYVSEIRALIDSGYGDELFSELDNAAKVANVDG